MTDGKEFTLSLLNSINGLKLEIAQVFPNILAGLTILILGIVTAYVLKWCSSILVKWVLRLVPSSIAKREFVKNNFEPLVLGTGRVLFLLTIFIAVAISLKKMGLHLASDWMKNFGNHLPNIIGALLILFIGWKTKEIVEDLTRNTFNRTAFAYSSFVSKALSWSIFIVCILVSLEQIGFDMSLVISVATVSVGVIAGGIALTFALGAKATISDILYCYQLHKYFKAGQQIELNGVKGAIKSIGPIFVLIETPAGKVTIPGNMFNREIATISSQETKTDV